MIEVAFWILVGLLVYLHGGYALLLAPVALLLQRRRLERTAAAGSETDAPAVTILVGAYNEEAALASKLDSLLAQDYRGRLDIVVVSDQSCDRTDEIARDYADRGVCLDVAPRRRGKAANFSAVIPNLQTPIVICTDAASRFDPDVTRRLVSHFADEEVGLVGGCVVYRNVDASGVSRGEGFYSRYEVLLRSLESRTGGTVIVSGACYAIRRSLFRPVRPDLPDDFMSSLNVWDQGFRVLYDPEARVDEEVATTLSGEFRTKTRIISRNAAAMWRMRRLLSPRRPALALKLLSHRLLRWLAAPMLALAIIFNIILLPRPAYVGLFASQVLFYVVAMVGLVPSLRNKRLILVPFYFCLVNVAASVGVWRALRGRTSGTWEPVERRAS